MPRISGPNIAQHVAAQESAVFDAAIRLFAEHGVENVTMGAIAEAVGLARPSLYRYFPTKSSIVVRWFDETMGPLIANSDEIARSETGSRRFDAWIHHQIAFLLNPANRAMILASLASDDLGDEERQTIGRGHRELYSSLQTIIADEGSTVDDHTLRTRVLLIAELLRAVGELTERGIPPELAEAELLRAARLIAAMGRGPEAT